MTESHLFWIAAVFIFVILIFGFGGIKLDNYLSEDKSEYYDPYNDT